MKSLFNFFILIIIACASFAQEQTDSIKVLFVGNSSTSYHRLPWMVQGIAKSNGIPLAVTVIEHGEGTFQKHASNRQTISAIKRGGWDFVVLQGHRHEPTREDKWVSKNVYPYAQKLDSIRKAHNPKGQTVLYMTPGEYVANYPQVQDKLANRYEYMAHQLNARCAPVGLAWKEFYSENCTGELHDTDNSNPNLMGAYLTANVFFTTFFNKEYTSDYTAGLSVTVAQYLQHLAQKVVLKDTERWNIP